MATGDVNWPTRSPDLVILSFAYVTVSNIEVIIYKPSNSSPGSYIVASRVFLNKLFHILFCILVNVRNQENRKFFNYILIFKKQLPTNKNKPAGTILVVPISTLKATNSTCT